MRAGDADRDDTIAILREAFAEGRLSQDEFDDRLERAHGARTYADLANLTEDLPVTSQSSDALVPGENSKRVKERKDLRSAWASWLGVGVLVNIIWFATWMGSGPAPYYWPIWVIGPWGGAMVIWTLTSKVQRPSNGSSAHG